MDGNHDKIRKGAQQNAKGAFSPLIKNEKYFVEPRSSVDNFKALFARLTAEGAGRPVDHQGCPDGPWTPEKLADAVSSIEENDNGIELRAVQIWFQDNDNGISNNNIRWLARIFGCDDPEATSQWQAELTAAKERLTAERRSKSKKAKLETAVSQVRETAEILIPNDTELPIRGINLALRTEAMFSGPNLLNLPIVVWGGLGVLWFFAFILGIHRVPYSPIEGVEKQVGLIWSPGWNIGDAIILPIFLIVVAGLLNTWRSTGRSLILGAGKVAGVKTWRSKVIASSISYWAILLICLLLIFLVQWAGVYLLPLQKNDPDVPMIDWMLIALVEPQVLSTRAAIFVSFLAFLYAGIIYWFLFTGMLLLHTISTDFAEICAFAEEPEKDCFREKVLNVGSMIIQGVYRCTVLGIFVACSIKLNAAYLVTDAESISKWLAHDVNLFMGLRDDEWVWINGSPSPFFTSFLLLALLCFVFVACMLPICSVLDRVCRSSGGCRGAPPIWIRLGIVLTLLGASYLLVGQVVGFSIILCFSVVVSFASLFWKIDLHDQKPQRMNG
jgi:hypothetical protein